MATELVRKVRVGDLVNCDEECPGGCIEACLASLTHVPVEEIPCTDRLDIDSWGVAMNRVITNWGFALSWIRACERVAPAGYHIVSDDSHAVVARDGEPVFDPSVDVGVDEIRWWFLVTETVSLG